MDHITQRAVLFLTLAAVASPSTAAVLRVKADAPGPAHDGASWATACISPGDALAAAAPGDEVWVAAGEYRSAASLTLREGVSLYGGFAGTESAREERDAAANVCTLRPADTDIPVITAPTGITAATVLDGFTITGGHGTKRGNAMYGGGMLCDGSSPTITHNVFTLNSVGARDSVPGYGGGIAVLGGSPVIDGNTFAGNGAGVDAGYDQGTGEGGGADIACIGGTANVRHNDFERPEVSASPRMYLADTDAVVRDNQWEGQSFALQIQPGATPTIQGNVMQNAGYLAIRCDGDARITGNTLASVGRAPYSQYAVGIRTYKSSPLIEGNSITGFGLRGLAVAGGAPLITANTITGNGTTPSNDSPCGVWLDATAAIVRDNLIENNAGAGISISSADPPDPKAVPTVTRNTIRGTTGPAVGSASPMVLSDNEITGNHGSGPAVSLPMYYRATASLVVRGNVIADNTTLGALYVHHSEGDVEISGNEILRNTCLAQNPATVTVWARRALFTGNRITDNFGPNVATRVTIIGPSVPLSQVRNNVLVRNTVRYPNGPGNAIYLQGRADVAGNTIADNALGRGAALYSRDANLLANNIVAFNGGGIQVEPSDYRQPILSHNLAYGNELGDYLISPDPNGQDGNLSADPLFVDRAAGGYRLLTGSPAINAGDDAVVQTGEQDVDGRPRLIGPRVDIGAFEYVPPDPALVAEALRALRIAAGLDRATSEDLATLDADASGAVNILDAARLLRPATGQP